MPKFKGIAVDTDPTTLNRELQRLKANAQERGEEAPTAASASDYGTLVKKVKDKKMEERVGQMVEEESERIKAAHRPPCVLDLSH